MSIPLVLIYLGLMAGCAPFGGNYLPEVGPTTVRVEPAPSLTPELLDSVTRVLQEEEKASEPSVDSSPVPPPAEPAVPQEPDPSGPSNSPAPLPEEPPGGSQSKASADEAAIGSVQIPASSGTAGLGAHVFLRFFSAEEGRLEPGIVVPVNFVPPVPGSTLSSTAIYVRPRP